MMIHANQDREFVHKIKLLLNIFGQDAVYAAIKKKTVQKWLRGGAQPSSRSLWTLCSSLGMTASEFQSPIAEFPAMLAGKPKHGFTVEQIDNEMKRIVESGHFETAPSRREGAGLMSVLSGVMSATHPKALEREFERLKGYYFCYLNWINWDAPESTIESSKIMIYRILMKITEYDSQSNMIKAELTSKVTMDSHLKYNTSEIWGFKGVVVPVPGTLYFIFENSEDSFYDMGYVFVATRDRPVDNLIGMLTAENREKKKDPFLPKTESLPAASRILMKKIEDDMVEKGEAYLFGKMDYYDPEDLEELDSDIIKSLTKDSRKGLLTIF